MISFGEYLKIYRCKANLTQTQLAELIGVQSQTIWRWEHNEREPSLNVIKKLAKVLNVTENELLNREKITDWVLTVKIS